MITDPADYRWLSHSHNVSGGEHSLITPHPEYLHLGSTPAARQAAYRARICEHLDEQQLAELRLHTRQQRAWGSDRLRQQIETLTQRAAGVRPRGRPCKLPITPGK